MTDAFDSARMDKRLMVRSAAAMYGAAAMTNLVEGLLPGVPKFSSVPGFGALLVAGFLLAVGQRLPDWVVAAFGPLGAAVIAYTVAEGSDVGDGAVLYMWPALWMAFFFRLRGAVLILVCIAVFHGVALLSLPAGKSDLARWVDVVVSAFVVVGVVYVLVRRNDHLVTRLADEARTDTLTGLLNRRGFQERAAIELTRTRRERNSIAVASFDVDYFKRINDEWGHDTGDLVLARLGRVLTENCRDLDIVARLGGEEFVVLMPDSDTIEAHALTQRVRCALAAPDPANLPAVRVSAGVVAAVAPTEIDTLLEKADTALYAAKRAGRDRTEIFDVKEPAGSPERAIA